MNRAYEEQPESSSKISEQAARKRNRWLWELLCEELDQDFLRDVDDMNAEEIRYWLDKKGYIRAYEPGTDFQIFIVYRKDDEGYQRIGVHSVKVIEKNGGVMLQEDYTALGSDKKIA